MVDLNTSWIFLALFFHEKSPGYITDDAQGIIGLFFYFGVNSGSPAPPPLHQVLIQVGGVG